ncbi:MAG: TonB-dependent siderophore receptor [Cyanobacteria bacterium P01_B01_bin.77]
MLNQLQRLLMVTSVFSVISVPAMGAELNDIGPTTQTADLAQIEMSVMQITDIQFEETATGLQVVLETSNGSLVTSETTASGNALILEIPNAQLALPSGDELLEFEPAEDIALVQVSSLTGNRVQVVITGDDGVPEVAVNSDVAKLTLSVVPGTIQADRGEDSLQIFVTGEDEGYNPSTATTGTRIDAPLRDIPQSIQVIPQQVLEDQAVIRTGDALRNVSGIGVVRDFGGSNFAFSARGFEDVRILRNGILSGEEDQSTVTIPSTIERIEVLKGPASVLYGRAEPGGLVNIITKQPLDEPAYEVQLRAGSFDFFEPSIDLTGPLTSDGKLTYRLNMSYLNDGLFRDEVDAELFSIAPVLRYEFSEDTDLTLEYEYAEDRRTFDDGIVFLGEGFNPLDVPGDRFLGEPDNFFNDTFHRFYATLNHRFNDNLRVRTIAGGEFEDSEVNAFRAFPFNEFDPVTGELTNRLFQTSEFFNSNFSWQTELTADFDTGPVKHQLLAGFDFTFSNFGIDPGENVFEGPFPINVFDPVYDETFPPNVPFDVFFDIDNEENSYGIFLQDLITLAPNLKLLVGGRYDFVRNEASSDGLFNGNPFGGDSELNDEAFSPRVGIVYQPVEPVSLYGNFTRSFVPSSVNTIEGDLIEPERGTQFEIGARAEFGDISVNLAAYDITKTNIAVADPDNPGFSLAIGEANSRGIELDVAGKILDGWNIIASGFINDTEVTEGDNFFPSGDRLRVAPENGASLWSTYEIQQGDLEGLGFGAGVFFVGESEAQLPNDFVIPSYTRFDASLFYRKESWEAQLNFQNLFDENYLELSDNSGVFGGAPFTVIGSLKYRF